MQSPRILAVAISVAMLAFWAIVAPASAEWPATITPQELSERIAAGRAPLILDVRTPEEYAAGHLPGARNIPYDALADRVGELALLKNDEVVVHCHTGRRAAVAEQVLRDAGYTNVRDLEGHWQGWQEAGFPVE